MGKKWLAALFIAKVCAGVLYGLFYSLPAYKEGSDSFRYFNLSLAETDWLLRDPAGFVKDFFSSGYNEPSNLFAAKNSYWNDLKDNTIIKLLAICNVFTGRSYFADVILFNFLFFFGNIACYRLAAASTNLTKPLLVAASFLIPSLLFWCSGIHKDGLAFSCTTLLLYYFHLALQGKKVVQNIMACLICALLLFALRNFMLLLLLPALAVWVLGERFPRKKIVMAIGVYLLCLVLFVSAPYIHPSLNLYHYLAERHNEFNNLAGGSKIITPALEPTFGSFARFLPAAIDIGFLRPHVNELHHVSYIPAFAENLALCLLIVICAVRFRRAALLHPLWLACICFSISMIILTGYTVTFSGAIVRYKSVVLPLLVIPLLQILLGNKKRV